MSCQFHRAASKVLRGNGYENIYKKTAGIKEKSCGLAFGGALPGLYDMFYCMADIPQHLFKPDQIPDGYGKTGVDRV